MGVVKNRQKLIFRQSLELWRLHFRILRTKNYRKPSSNLVEVEMHTELGSATGVIGNTKPSDLPPRMSARDSFRQVDATAPESEQNLMEQVSYRDEEILAR